MERFSTGRNDGHTAKAVVLAIGVLLTGVLSLGAALWAQPEGPPPGPPPWQGGGPGPHGCMGGLQGLSKRLGLTDDQVNKIESLRLEFLKETVDLEAQLNKKELELAGLLRDPQAKEESITAVQKELTRLMTQKEEKALAYRLKARVLLSPEQIKNLPPGCSLGIPCAGPRGCGMGGGHVRGGGCPWTM